jgi:transcriptional regulator with XRE-family HTH domain
MTTNETKPGHRRDTGAYLRQVGERVRKLRNQRGMTRKALVQHARISERYLAQLELGKGNCSIVLLRRIARAIVDARRGNELFINDGSYGTLFDAAHMGFNFPVRLLGPQEESAEPMMPFSFWGPTCDTIDFMPGPFHLPAKTREGDYIEIGNTGAYGRAIAGRFNGYGAFDEAILLDAPMLTMYPADAEADRRNSREAQQVQA